MVKAHTTITAISPDWDRNKTDLNSNKTEQNRMRIKELAAETS